MASDIGDLLRLDDDAEPATASTPATATPNYLGDLLGADLSVPTSTANPAPQIDLLDLLGGDPPPSTSGAPPTPAVIDPYLFSANENIVVERKTLWEIRYKQQR